MGPDHSGVELGRDSRLIPSGEVISTANSLLLNTRPWEDNPQTHDAKNVAANDILTSYSVLQTTKCVCLAGATDILPKFVDSPGYSRHDGAIGRQNRQDALAMHTRCPRTNHTNTLFSRQKVAPFSQMSVDALTIK